MGRGSEKYLEAPLGAPLLSLLPICIRGRSPFRFPGKSKEIICAQIIELGACAVLAGGLHEVRKVAVLLKTRQSVEGQLQLQNVLLIVARGRCRIVVVKEKLEAADKVAHG